MQVLHGILYAVGGSTFHHENTVERLIGPDEYWTTSGLDLVTGNGEVFSYHSTHLRPESSKLDHNSDESWL